jgi:NADP-dependent 3-hydroxy acid dehydrogenase YdfG
MVLTVTGDIADPAVDAGLIEQGQSAFGPIDTLINNAGVVLGQTLHRPAPDLRDLEAGRPRDADLGRRGTSSTS